MEGRAIRPNYAAHIGLNVHKDTIAVAVAIAGREPPVYVGEIGEVARKLARTQGGEVMLCSYQAGPCGYEVYRRLTESGFDGEVVAPSRTPARGRIVDCSHHCSKAVTMSPGSPAGRSATLSAWRSSRLALFE